MSDTQKSMTPEAAPEADETRDMNVDRMPAEAEAPKPAPADQDAQEAPVSTGRHFASDGAGTSPRRMAASNDGERLRAQQRVRAQQAQRTQAAKAEAQAQERQRSSEPARRRRVAPGADEAHAEGARPVAARPAQRGAQRPRPEEEATAPRPVRGPRPEGEAMAPRPVRRRATPPDVDDARSAQPAPQDGAQARPPRTRRRPPRAAAQPQPQRPAPQPQPVAADPAPAPKRRRSLFWPLYGVLVVLLVAGSAFALTYTYGSLTRYEESQSEKFVQHFMDDLKAGGQAANARRDECLSNIALSPYETQDLLTSRFDQGVGKQSYRFEQGGLAFDASSPTYTIYADEVPYLTIHLVPEKTYVRLSLLTITEWAIDHVVLHTPTMPEDADQSAATGLSYDVSVPENATVTANGVTVGPEARAEGSTVMPGFEYASQFVDVPEAVIYKLDGLVTEPAVTARDFYGQDIELTKTGYSFAASSLSEPNRTADELPVDPLAVGEAWSSLMTNDLAGGIGQVNAFLIPGSELYNQANSYVSSVDSTFVVGHSMNGFSEESVTNCVMYNDDLFSCDVHFVKNMSLGSGEYRGDEFNNTMIFAYVDDSSVDTPGWYLVNMQAITDNG